MKSRKFIAGLLLALVAIDPAWAGSMTLLGAGKPSATAAPYAGPIDVYGSAKVWFGLRAASAADKGNALINLCDDTGANCSDVSSDATTGALSNPGTHGSNNCATSGTCKVATVYDRSGATACTSTACNLTNGTNSQRPTLNWNSGNPYLVFASASSQRLCSANNVSPFTNQPLTVSWVGLRSSGTGFQNTFGTTTIETGFNNSANTLFIYGTAPVGTLSGQTDGNFYAVQAVFNGASSSILSNSTGSPTTVTTGGGAFNAELVCIGSTPGGANFLNGQWREAGLWAGSASTSNQASVNTQQRSFWSF